MKAQPCKLIQGKGYEPCPVSEVTHLRFRMPGPSDMMVLPVQTHGTRAGIPNWTWNGDVNRPTLRPSILSKMGRDGKVVCHSWLNDGKVQFLGDSTHEFAGQTLDLLDLPDA